MVPDESSLEAMYHEIGRQGVGALELHEWPRSSYFLEHCTTGPDGAPSPRRFDQHPVVGFNVMLDEDPAHVALLHKAQRVFRDMLQEARERCLSPKAAAEWAKTGVYWTSPRSWHTVVAIFQEHPALLPEAERADWSPVPIDKLEHDLGTELRADLWAYPVPPLAVRLHGLRVCADGALIACFVEADPSAPAFAPLRSRVKDIATKVLGPLTSRPKRLIHVTLGRVLSLPTLATSDELANLRRTMRAMTADLHTNRIPAEWLSETRAVPGDWRVEVEGKSTHELAPIPGMGDVLRIVKGTVTVERQWWMAAYDKVTEIRLAERDATRG